MTTVDTDGKTIKVTENNQVRVDGIFVFRRIRRAGVVYLQFWDTDRLRAKCRGSRYVEIPLQVLVEKIKQSPIQEAKQNE